MSSDGISAVELRRRLLARELSLSGVVEDLIARVGDDDQHAWAFRDVEALYRRAAALDALDLEARERLPLFGIPVAIKDNFDTASMPTEYGSSIYAGHRPDADAAIVAQLLAAGALLAGKTKCAEFAWMTPPDTLNPLDRARTPGGSSNGSAVAIAAGHVPVATGSQTAGSINRPASYCGIAGFKPSFGRYDRAGIKPMSETLDTAGLLGRSLDDLALFDAVLAAVDGDAVDADAVDADAGPARIAFAPTPLWDRIEEDAAGAIESWVLDARRAGLIAAGPIELPGYARLTETQGVIQSVESARSLAPELASSAELLSDELRAALERGAAVAPETYAAALTDTATLRPALVAAIDRYDAVLTPSATGVPPVGLHFTGDPLFCRVWTLLGAPSLSLPLAWTFAGLPAGLQLVAVPGGDRRLLATASELLRRLR